MKTYLFAIVIAFGALFGLSVQAAPPSPQHAVIESQAITGDALQKVQHWRWGSHHRWHGGHWRWGSRGWGYGWHSRYRSHWRWGSRY